jgi:hypothetical protein
MSWSDKYKRSINCDNPKGFSQLSHCQGKKKKLKEQLKPYKTAEQIAKKHRLDVSFIQKQLDMGEPIEHEHTKDHKLAMEIALQHLDEIPDYYTRLKKMETSAKKEHKKFKDISEEGLRDWFGKSKSKDGKSGWVNVVTGGTCASDEPGEGVPKCVSSSKRASMTKAERLSASIRKKKADSGQQEKSGAANPTYVATDSPRKKMKEEMDLKEAKDKPGKGSGKKDACYSKVKSRYSVWPSAYASGALVKCRKVGADNWGTKSEQVNIERYCPKCKKNEFRDDCKYGAKYWDMYSLPVNLSSVAMSNPHYHANSPHPANEERDHEYSMARSELSTIIAAVKRLKKKMKGEGNLESWVQSKITKAADYIDTAADYVDSGEMAKESVSIEDVNGNHYAKFIDIIKPVSLKPSKGIGSRMLGEGPSFEIGGRKTTGMKNMTPQDVDRLKSGNPGAAEKIDKTYKSIRQGINLPSVTKKTQVNHYEPEGEVIDEKCWSSYKKKGMKTMFGKRYPNCVKVEGFSNWRADFGLSEDWQSVNRKDKTDGLSQKAVNAYRRENPGSKLQTAVTEKKPKGKRAKRRKNFCSRMSGMKAKLTSAKTARDPDSRINKALRRWNCN